MIELIKKRLEKFHCTTPLAEEQALKEIVQEVALYSLWRAGFFDVAAFQGGTSLRILYGLPRFSEDLDFILKQPDQSFDWKPYLNQLQNNLQDFGMLSEAVDKSRMDQRIKKALLKDNSVANQLNLSFFNARDGRKLRIKLEIDVNPPGESGFEYQYLDFPLDFEVCAQDMPSNFSLKIHALLCRPYLKGRDWYDFSWYLAQGTHPNILHLQAALKQYGPWQDLNLTINTNWLKEVLKEKIRAISWDEAKQDVERFLGDTERESLELWGLRFFQSKVDKL
jgi:predicted nucleotidyltransferase component of viral defense system